MDGLAPTTSAPGRSACRCHVSDGGTWVGCAGSATAGCGVARDVPETAEQKARRRKLPRKASETSSETSARHFASAHGAADGRTGRPPRRAPLCASADGDAEKEVGVAGAHAACAGRKEGRKEGSKEGVGVGPVAGPRRGRCTFRSQRTTRQCCTSLGESRSPRTKNTRGRSASVQRLGSFRGSFP
jgi:hypothetical protein